MKIMLEGTKYRGKVENLHFKFTPRLHSLKGKPRLDKPASILMKIMP